MPDAPIDPAPASIDPVDWLWLAKNVARKYVRHAGGRLDLEDLEQEAAIALLYSAKHFNGRGQFRKYAVVHMARRVRAALNAMHRPLRVPHDLHELDRAIRRGKYLEAELSPRQRARLDAARRALALGLVREGDLGDLPLDELLAAREPDPGPDTGPLQEALARLGGRRREVIARRFGLETGEGQELETIGLALGVTRQRVWQLERAALATLRRVLGA
jgi:RNA polymerase sigma factor (sigma-70 family)